MLFLNFSDGFAIDQECLRERASFVVATTKPIQYKLCHCIINQCCYLSALLLRQRRALCFLYTLGDVLISEGHSKLPSGVKLVICHCFFFSKLLQVLRYLFPVVSSQHMQVDRNHKQRESTFSVFSKGLHPPLLLTYKWR